jgi:hypothetical protein
MEIALQLPPVRILHHAAVLRHKKADTETQRIAANETPITNATVNCNCFFIFPSSNSTQTHTILYILSVGNQDFFPLPHLIFEGIAISAEPERGYGNLPYIVD